MTCCGFGTNIFPRKGRLSSYDIEARQRSKEIDSELKIERKKRQHQVRLLLLGAGESGILAKTCPNVQYAYNQYNRIAPFVMIMNSTQYFHREIYLC